MTFIDFFAGVGGFRKGLELAGHKCLGFCEYDKFAVQSYQAIHKTEGEWYAKDIREVRANDIPRADMWCAGFPCQDISVAGKQFGFKGKRSSLFFTVTGLVRDLEEKNKPSVLFFENVKNLLSVNRGFDFAKLLAELDEIGYDAEWTLINSADVVPQNRERVFVIGHLRGRNGQQVFPIGESNRKIEKTNINIVGSTKPKKSTRFGQRDKVYSVNGIMGALNATDYKQPKQIAIGDLYSNSSEKFQSGILPNMSRTLKSNQHDACVAVKQIANVMPTKTRNNPNQGRVYDTSGIAPTLNCCGGGGHEPKIVCPSANSYISIRKLTPLECWRLQGWQDVDFFKAFFLSKELGVRFNKIYQKHKQNPVRLMQWAFKHQKMSDSQLYKQAGNGVTVTVIQRIGERLKEVKHDV